MKSFVVASLLVCSFVAVYGKPQYGGGAAYASSGAAASSGAPAGAPAPAGGAPPTGGSNYGGGAGGPPAGGPPAGGPPAGGPPAGGPPAGGPPAAPAGGSYGGNNGGSSSGGGSGGSAGGPLMVECKQQETSPGNFKFVCEGVNKDTITLRSEHILWLQNDGGKQQVLDIEVPNYKIDELIKAGFKTTPGQGPKINVLLKKPEQTYDAEVDVAKPQSGTPSVNLQYEPVEKQTVHFPNQKPYKPLSGPILPPARK